MDASTVRVGHALPELAVPLTASVIVAQTSAAGTRRSTRERTNRHGVALAAVNAMTKPDTTKNVSTPKRPQNANGTSAG